MTQETEVKRVPLLRHPTWTDEDQEELERQKREFLQKGGKVQVVHTPEWERDQ